MFSSFLEKFSSAKDPAFDTLFFRILGIFCFLLSSLYWIKIIGFYNSPLWRIDLMPRCMQIFSSIFAILYPIVLCGVWFETRWGKLLWVIAICLEISFSILYPQDFSMTKYIIIIHILFLGTYAIARLKAFMQYRHVQ